jgi:hypothetical protein
MEDSFLKVKYDKLVFELKYLEADLHYHDSILGKGTPEFESQCRSAIENLGLENVFYGDKSAAENYAKKESEIEQESAKKIKPSKATAQLFRKIASQTHPDKLAKLEGEDRAAKEKIFREATIAKDEDDLLKLHIIAADLLIEIPELSLEDILMFEKRIGEIKSQIDSKKGTWVWAWLISPKDKRDKIITDYVDLMTKTVMKKPSDTE